MTRSAGTVTSLKRVTVPQHPNKKGRAGSVTLIGQSPSAHQTSPWGGSCAEVGLAVEWGLGHEVGCRTGATGLRQGPSRNVAPAGIGTPRRSGTVRQRPRAGAEPAAPAGRTLRCVRNLKPERCWCVRFKSRPSWAFSSVCS